MGRDLNASREGSNQVVEVKVKGPGGVVGCVKEQQLVSKKVSYKVDIDCCFIPLLIAGIAFAATRIVFNSCTIIILRGDCTRNN